MPVMKNYDFSSSDVVGYASSDFVSSEEEMFECLNRHSKEMIKRQGNEVEVFLLEEVSKEKNERLIIYRTYSMETKRIEILAVVQGEKP